MEKLKELRKWIGSDGLLHFLVCYAVTLTLTPFVGVWWTLLIVIATSCFKEAWDYFVQRDNDKEQVIHDLICDGAGVMIALTVLILWNI